MSKESSPSPKNSEVSASQPKGRLRRWADSNAISMPAILIGAAALPSIGGALLLGFGGFLEVKGAKDFIFPPDRNRAKKVATPAASPRRTT